VLTTEGSLEPIETRDQLLPERVGGCFSSAAEFHATFLDCKNENKWKKIAIIKKYFRKFSDMLPKA